MKTTIEIPDAVFRKAKSRAAERGETLKEFVTDALRQKLAPALGTSRVTDPDWMRGFGALHRLTRETRRVQDRIDEAFELVEPEDRA